MSPRMKPTDRRAQIIESAITVVSQRGIAGFRIRDVADTAGISQPLVSSHFRSRDELLLAAFVLSDQRALVELSARSAAAPNGRAALRIELMACLDGQEVDEAVHLWQEVWTHGFAIPELRQAVRERQRAWTDRFAVLIRRAVEDGSAQPDVDVEQAATAINVLLDGVAPALRWEYLDAATASKLIDDELSHRLGGDDTVIST